MDADWMYSAYHYSHPILTERLKAVGWTSETKVGGDEKRADAGVSEKELYISTPIAQMQSVGADWCLSDRLMVMSRVRSHCTSVIAHVACSWYQSQQAVAARTLCSRWM